MLLEIFNKRFIAKLLLSLTVKEFSKSVNFDECQKRALS